MIVVGLIGPIAAGKSVVLETLAGCGAATIRADDVSRELLAPGSKHLKAVIEAFGEGCVGPDGKLKRGKLAALIFRDAQAREKLNCLLHPAMVDLMRQKIEELSRSDPARVVVIEVANLVEMGGLDLVDRVVMVAAPRAERLHRLMTRDGLSEPEAEERLRVHEQMAIEEADADYVLDASGREEDTQKEAERLWSQLVEDTGTEP